MVIIVFEARVPRSARPADLRAATSSSLFVPKILRREDMRVVTLAQMSRSEQSSYVFASIGSSIFGVGISWVGYLDERCFILILVSSTFLRKVCSQFDSHFNTHPGHWAQSDYHEVRCVYVCRTKFTFYKRGSHDPLRAVVPFYSIRNGTAESNFTVHIEHVKILLLAPVHWLPLWPSKTTSPYLSHSR